MGLDEEYNEVLANYRAVENSKPTAQMTDGQATVFRLKRQSNLIRLNRELSHLKTLQTIESYRNRGDDGK